MFYGKLNLFRCFLRQIVCFADWKKSVVVHGVVKVLLDIYFIFWTQIFGIGSKKLSFESK